MIKNNKGFTLIELLAVIIILAIIALITTPIILNVVNDARKSAAQDKAWGTIDAVRLAFAQDQGTSTPGKPNDPTTNPVNFKVVFPSATIGNTPVKMSGDKPTAGTVIIKADGTITASGLVFGNFTCTTTDGTAMNCTSS